MRILQIFNRYTHVGGEELVFERITRDLQAEHVVENVTFYSADWLQRTGFFSRCRQLALMTWNPASIRTVFQSIKDFKPDVIVLHNLMPVGSAALYWRLSRCGVPLIHYVHNFRPFSVNGYCWGNGKLLPEGLDKNYFPEIAAGSWQDSRIKTGLYAILLWLMHAVGVYRRIDGWIAISGFMREMFIKGGIEPDRIEAIAHSWEAKETEAAAVPSPSADATILFLGRLTEEKGVIALLDAWAQVEQSTSEGRLVIAGDGPLVDLVRQRCLELKRAEYIGFTTGEEKRTRLRDCRALVVPSVWWEPLGLVLYEAYEFSKPVIAARTGGIVEHVEDGKQGWLHEPGDVSQLAAHLVEAIHDPEKCHTLGQAGRKLLQNRQANDWLDRFNTFAQTTIQRKQGSATKQGSAPPPHGVKAEKLKTEKRKEEVRGQESEVRDQEPGASDLSLLPPSTKHQAPSTAPQAPPLPHLLSSVSSSSVSSPSASSPLSLKTENCKLANSPSISIYLADQNPKLGRSLGITRMTEVVMEEMQTRGTMDLLAVASKSSVGAPVGMGERVLPWGTRHTVSRLLTDHLHPLFLLADRPDVWYYPKGFLPALHNICSPSVVTIHDTIVQYYADYYPKWRSDTEYRYWAHMLRHTLTNADHVLTVSESSKRQILDFMVRHEISAKEITVTYEPCFYESIPQPEAPEKGDYVLHLASREPHKRTSWLIDHWLESDRKDLPRLHVVGALPDGVAKKIEASDQIEKLPFLDDADLQVQFMGARALVFPSEIEGFGLPAIEAYYLGTPVCFVKGTSVEEVLAVATDHGGFHLNDPKSLDHALADVLAMPPTEIHRIGLHLRKTYAATKVVDRMVDVFEEAAAG